MHLQWTRHVLVDNCLSAVSHHTFHLYIRQFGYLGRPQTYLHVSGSRALIARYRLVDQKVDIL
jgi:hypothetical protein